MYDTNFDPFSVLARRATDEMPETYINNVADKITYIIFNTKALSNEKINVR